MDFAAPPAVLDALRRRIDHGVFGYAEPWPTLVEAVVEGIARDHRWRIQPDWLVWLPGVVTGLNVACRTVGEAGDEVFTATPVYPPFLTAPGNAGRILASRPLVVESGVWRWDREATEAAVGPHTRLFMLCNPHNPVGRAFDRDELAWIAGLAERHDLVICSDEIHCGLVLDEASPHLPIAALGEAVARRTITLMAPSKTFNLPGLGCSFAVIPAEPIRRSVLQTKAGIVPMINPYGYLAAQVAYRDGEEWRLALISYLRGNRDLLAEALAGMPGGLSMAPVEGTYLAWLDIRRAGLDEPVRFFEEAGVGLQDGREFDGPGFLRLNFGCPRSVLIQALARMKQALDKRFKG
jgi:cystathionine beta-lyase